MKRLLPFFLLIFCGLIPLSGYAQTVPEVLYLQAVTAVEGCPGSEIDNALKIWSNASQNLTVTRTFYAGANCEGEPGSVSTFEIAPLGLTTPVVLKITLPQGMRSCKFSVASQNLNTDACIPLTVKAAPTRLYVNAGATGANTGLTWTDAFTDLQSALNYLCSENLTEIWVAAGTYKPGTVRADAFVMKNGVALYGGFNGSETQLSQRNWRSNATILSGDIGTQGMDTDNTYRVINNNFTAGSPLNNTAVLDGFIVEKGYADGGFPLNLGGGMWNAYASPKVQNCVFRNNYATSGAAIFNDNSEANVTNCLFTGNSCNIAGAAMSNGGGTASAKVVNCTFYGNTGGNSTIHNEVNATAISNCIIRGNTNGVLGGTVSYSIVQGDFAGMYNLNADPLFMNAAGGDFRLQACSPAIDLSTSTGAPSNDFNNNARVDAFAGGNIVDAGIYEYQSTIPNGQRFYVNATSPNIGNGSSWACATNDLQVALALAGSGDEIWVAAGTYKPTTSTNRTISFVMKNGVAIYGGFNGTETQLSQRNRVTNGTTLSGDIGTVGDISDNSYHVILNYDNGLTGTAILDGFTITGGNESRSFPDGNGGGMYNYKVSPTVTNCIFTGNAAAYGAGMLNNEGSPTVTNCLFSANTSGNNGGGMQNIGNTPAILNCRFHGNFAPIGGAMHNLGASPTITNCVFTSNSASINSGGIRNVTASPTIINCTFYGNTAGTGAAMYSTQSSLPGLTNCIVWGNSNRIADNSSTTTINYSIIQGGFIGTGNLDTDPLFMNAANGDFRLQACSPAIDAGTNTGAPTTDLDGNARPFNAAGLNRADIGAYELQTALPGVPQQFGNNVWNVYAWNSGGASIPNASAWSTGYAGYYVDNNLDINTELRWPVTGSPSQASGYQGCTVGNDNHSYSYKRKGFPSGTYQLDVKNHEDAAQLWINGTKVWEHDGCCDAHAAIWSGTLGSADELEFRVTEGVGGSVAKLNVIQCPPSNVVYVNANATGANNGTSWTNAFTDLQTALSHLCNSVTEIWVAAGTYKPTTGTDRSLSFVMKNGVALYGGFNGTETQLSQRNWLTNVTTLSGDIGPAGDAGNSYIVVFAGPGVNTTAILDGFTVTGAAGGTYAAGIYADNGSPTISHCLLTGNSSTVFGGGLGCYNASPIITGCTFSGNTSNAGGGMANGFGGMPIVTNCLFINNTVTYFAGGGGLYSFEAPMTLTNCTFSGNSPESIHCNTAINISNCVIWGNSLNFYNANAGISNCIIEGGYNLCNNCPNGNGNANPLFVNAAGGDFRLQACSPAINAGNDANNSTTTDLAGNNRKVGTIDMGAYEYQSAPTAAISPTVEVSQPTTCGGVNGNISLSGLLINTTYSIAYKKNTAGVAAANFTSNGTGVITLTGLGAGNYTDIVATYGTCVSNAASATLNDPAKPSLTLGTIPDICTGAMSFTIPYTNPVQSPNKYSISGDGITGVTEGDLNNPITATLSGPAAGSSLSFTLTIKNTTTNCVSDNISDDVTIATLSAGGTVSTAQTICSGTSPADLTLSNQVGNVVKWQKSTDMAFSTPADIVSTTTTLTGATIGNLTANTYFRAVVQNGVCAEAFSEAVLITVNPISAGGAVGNAQTICSGTSPADLTLSNQTGNVLKWQKSTNMAFSTPVDIVSTATTLTSATIGNLTDNTYFRAVLQSGVCAEAVSSPVPITVNPISAGGAVSTAQTICSGTAPADLSLSNQVGNVVKWQKSTDMAFSTPADIVSTTTTLTGATIGNLTANTYFRAVVQSGVCSEAVSIPVLITVNSLSIGGTAGSAQTICSGTAPADLSLSNQVGNVVKWQKSADVAFSSSVDIVSTATTLTSATIGNLTATTYFRAVVQSGVCSEAVSSPVLITVNPISAGGAVSTAQTICSGTAPADLSLSNQVGNVVKWQKSTDMAFSSSIDIVSTSTTLASTTIGNLTATTYFRAVLQSGVCSEAVSSPVLITVDPLSAGGTVGSAQTICANTAPADLSLSNQVGNVVKWQKSADVAFSSPVDIVSTATTLTSATIGNLTATTYFRAVLQSGVCAKANSSPVLVTVVPQPVGPAINVKTPNTDAICFGSTVSATFNAGSGGVGCSDDFIVSIDGANPVAYTPGSNVGATATTSILIQGRRANCSTGLGCNGTDYTPLASWTVNPLPTASILNNSSPFCAGANAAFTLSGTNGATLTYTLTGLAGNQTLLLDGTNQTITINNAPSDITLTLLSVTKNDCPVMLSATATVTVYPLPTDFALSGGGISFCQTPLSILVESSQAGVSYQLKRNNVNLGSPLQGTGSSLPFSGLTQAGTYSVVATTAVGNCAHTLSDQIIIQTRNAPTAYNLTGGGASCSGSPVSIILSNSQIGVLYQLKRANTPVGNPMPGTGNALSFPPQNTPGNYTAVALTQCADLAMNNTVSITSVITPGTFTVTGGGTSCGTPLPVGLSGSQSVVFYQLYRNGSPVGTTIQGTGQAISLGNHLTQGTYTIVATRAGECATTMSGSVSITLIDPPALFSVTGGGAACPAGVPISLSSSQNGIQYQLKRGNTLVSEQQGDGNSLFFPNQTVAGTYTVEAISILPGNCTRTMSGNAILTAAGTLPNVYSMTGGGALCNNVPVALGLSDSQKNVSYQLQRNTPSGFVNVGTAVQGTGSALALGTHSTLGEYRVVVHSACVTEMTGRKSITACNARVAVDSDFSHQPTAHMTHEFVRVMPNPVSKTLHLKVSEAKNQKVNVNLLDVSGRSVLQRAFMPESNQHQEEFEVSEIAAGMYFIQIKTADKQATLKVVKVE